MECLRFATSSNKKEAKLTTEKERRCDVQRVSEIFKIYHFELLSKDV